MEDALSIGDFSRMTQLSVKALRYYHDAGLLAPAHVDRDTRYRSYSLTQVATARVIRRFRALGMPLEHIKAVLATSDVDERNTLIASHLRQMESDLEKTRLIVASLRAMLEEPLPDIAVEYRSLPGQRVAAISREIEIPNISSWFADSFHELDRALRKEGITSAGPRGGLFPTELFTDEVGEVTLFIPIAEAMSPLGNVEIRELPPVEIAVAVHRGSFRDVDRTFTPLGTHVIQRSIAIDGPIREHYLVTADDSVDETRFVTEIGWPIFRTQ